jgi:hypothetical protein
VRDRPSDAQTDQTRDWDWDAPAFVDSCGAWESGGGWALVAPRLLQASVTYDPPSLAAAEGVTNSLAVPGAALGDLARASFSLDLQGITLTAWVSAADTVSVRFQNGTASAIDLGSGTLRVRVEKAAS